LVKTITVILYTICVEMTILESNWLLKYKIKVNLLAEKKIFPKATN